MASTNDELAAYFASINASNQAQQQNNAAALQNLLGYGGNMAELSMAGNTQNIQANAFAQNPVNRQMMPQTSQAQLNQAQMNQLLAYVQSQPANSQQQLNQQQQLTNLLRQPQNNQLQNQNYNDPNVMQDLLNRMPNLHQNQMMAAQRPMQANQQNAQVNQQAQSQVQNQINAQQQQGWARMNERRGASAGLPGQPQPQPQQQPNQPLQMQAQNQAMLHNQQQLQNNAALMQALQQQGTPLAPQLAQSFQQAARNNAVQPGYQQNMQMPTPDMSQLVQPLGQIPQQGMNAMPLDPQASLVIDYARNLSQLNTLRNRVKTLEQCMSEGKVTVQNNGAQGIRRNLSNEERETYQRALLNDRAAVQRLNAAVDAFQRANGGLDAANASVSELMRNFGKPGQAGLPPQAQAQQPPPPPRPNTAAPVRPPPRSSTPQQKVQNEPQGLVLQAAQQIVFLQSAVPPEAVFNNQVYEQCSKMQPVPAFPANIDGNEINLYVLFRHVLNMGGSGAVSNAGAWGKILGKIGLLNAANANDQQLVERWAQRCQFLFRTYLLAYETAWSQSILRKVQLQTQQQQQQSAIQTPQTIAQGLPATPQLGAQPTSSTIPYLAQFLTGTLPRDPRVLQKIGFSNAQIENYMKTPQPQAQAQMQMPTQAMQQQMQQPVHTQSPNLNFQTTPNLNGQPLPMQATLQQQAQTQMQINNLLRGQLPVANNAAAAQLQAQAHQQAQAQTQAHAQAQLRQRQLSQNQAQSQQQQPVENRSANPFAPELMLIAAERQKMTEKVDPRPLDNLTDSDKANISTTMEKLNSIIKAVQERLPQMVRSVPDQANKVGLIHRVLHLITVYNEATAQLQHGVFSLDSATLHAMKDKLLGYLSLITNPNTAASQSASMKPAANSEEASVETLLSARPGLKMEDLKQPPQRHKRTTTVGSPAVNANSPMAIDSPQKQEVQTPRPMAAPSPNIGAALVVPVKATNTVQSPRPMKARRTKSQAKFPTADDIMAEVKNERKAKAPAAITPKPAETAQDKRQRELLQAENDPIAFVEKAWNGLAAALPNGQLSDQVNADFLLRDLTGALDFGDGGFPQKSRSASTLSFVAAAPGFASASASSSKTIIEDDYDWSCFINEDAANIDTPELGTSPKSNATTTPKDDLPPTPSTKANDLPTDQKTSRPMAKRKSTEAVESGRLSKRQSTNEITDLFSHFDWDAEDIKPVSWSIVS